MSKNLLDQLANVDIPPPPVEFGNQVHRRLNDRLVIFQIVELAVCALPVAMVHFARALFGACKSSLSGNYSGGPEHE